MSKTRTVQLEKGIDIAAEKYIEKHDISFNKLVNLAVKEFISKPHTIHLIPVNTEAFVDGAKKAFNKHKNAMDKLK